MAYWREIVKSGRWLYDNMVWKPVYILRQNYDPLYEEGFDDEPPTLNDDGVSYTVAFGEPTTAGRFLSEHMTHLSEEGAIAQAKALVGQIEWDDTQPIKRITLGS